MKREEINKCLRQYRKSVETYRILADQLRSLRAGADVRSPLYRKMERAEEALEEMGQGLSFLPELALEVRELQRICAAQRWHLKAGGIEVQYRDRPAASGQATDDEDELGDTGEGG